jgi:hypothetical protein
MGVYIKNMTKEHLTLIFKADGLLSRCDDIIEVPEPHGRLIDADMLLSQIYITNSDGETVGEYVGIPPAWVHHAPTVIEAEE